MSWKSSLPTLGSRRRKKRRRRRRRKEAEEEEEKPIYMKGFQRSVTPQPFMLQY